MYYYSMLLTGLTDHSTSHAGEPWHKSPDWWRDRLPSWRVAEHAVVDQCTVPDYGQCSSGLRCWELVTATLSKGDVDIRGNTNVACLFFFFVKTLYNIKSKISDYIFAHVLCLTLLPCQLRLLPVHLVCGIQISVNCKLNTSFLIKGSVGQCWRN